MSSDPYFWSSQWHCLVFKFLCLRLSQGGRERERSSHCSEGGFALLMLACTFLQFCVSPNGRVQNFVFPQKKRLKILCFPKRKGSKFCFPKRKGSKFCISPKEKVKNFVFPQKKRFQILFPQKKGFKILYPVCFCYTS